MAEVSKEIEDVLRSNLKIEDLVRTNPRASVKITQSLHVSLCTIHAQEIVDISANCGTSFSIVIVSADFQGKPKLARHKLGQSTVACGLVVHCSSTN